MFLLRQKNARVFLLLLRKLKSQTKNRIGKTVQITSTFDLNLYLIELRIRIVKNAFIIGHELVFMAM